MLQRKNERMKITSLTNHTFLVLKASRIVHNETPDIGGVTVYMSYSSETGMKTKPHIWKSGYSILFHFIPLVFRASAIVLIR